VVALTVVLALGIWAADQADPNFPLLLLFSGGGALGLVALLNRLRACGSDRWLVAALYLAGFVAGMLRLGWVNQLPNDALLHRLGETVSIRGIVSEPPRVAAGPAGEWSVRYRVRVSSLKPAAANELPKPVQGGVALTVRQDGPIPTAVAGDSIFVTGKLRALHSYQNPGQPDRRAALSAQGIDVRLSVVPGSFRVSRHAESDSLLERLARWRDQLRQTLLLAMPGTDAALIMGMLFGGYDGIERQTVREFATTGIVHILSVSGAHIALLAGAVFWLAGRLRLRQDMAAAIAAATMIGYGFLSGFSAPVIRSVIMGLICMTALAFDRRASAKRALALAVLGMLIYQPYNLFDISFQLSIGCTAGLLYLQPVLLAWLRRGLPEPVAQAMAATLAAQLAVIPFLAWYFGTFPLISLVANLLVAPLLEAVILLGLLATILAGALEPLAQVLFVGVSLLLGLGVELNRFLCRMPGGTLNLPAVGVAGSAVYYAMLLWTCGFAEKWGLSPSRLWRWGAKNLALSSGAALLFILLFGWLILRPGPLQVHFIDVGQGDATLIITPNRRAVLVDSGGALGAQTDFDVGERVVVPYLRHVGVNRVDWLILTHNHQDHAGGAAAVAAFVGVQQALLHQEEPVSAAILRLQQAMRFRNLHSPDELAEIQIDGVRLELLQAGELSEEPVEKTKNKEKPTAGNREKAASASENGRSTVVRLSYGRHQFLLTGDLEGESEKKLMQQSQLASTVLKVGHHGGRKSSQTDFLQRVLPQYAVVSVGADNRFGHPAPETVQRITELPALLLRTDRDGAVVFRSDGKNLSFLRTAQ
jgi:competence protein ComEC